MLKAKQKIADRKWRNGVLKLVLNQLLKLDF